MLVAFLSLLVVRRLDYDILLPREHQKVSCFGRKEERQLQACVLLVCACVCVVCVLPSPSGMHVSTHSSHGICFRPG
jgi:hypothetical protein